MNSFCPSKRTPGFATGAWRRPEGAHHDRPSPRVPTRTLRAKPDLAQLKRQARELLEKFLSGDAAAVAEVHSHVQGTRAESFALHDAQLVLARAYGFPSWPKLKAYVDGVTIQQFVEAARAGDLATVRRMAAIRPELVNLDVAANDEHQALHHAVIGRHPDVVRFLVQHGANARKGIYPHREATSALTLAIERGYTDIAQAIREEEARRTSPPPAADLPGIDALREAFQRDDEDAVIAGLDAHPELARAGNQGGRTALHWAVSLLWERLAAWLIARGADVNGRATNGDTPLDVVGSEGDSAGPETAAVASRLVRMLRTRARHKRQKALWRRAMPSGCGLAMQKVAFSIRKVSRSKPSPRTVPICSSFCSISATTLTRRATSVASRRRCRPGERPCAAVGYARVAVPAAVRHTFENLEHRLNAGLAQLAMHPHRITEQEVARPRSRASSEGIRACRRRPATAAGP